MLKINEIFGPTIQGEGLTAGKEVLFIRTSLCNLYCHWCDTAYTWNWQGTHFAHQDNKKYSKEEEIHLMSVEQIVNEVTKIPVKSIIISGGEPLVQQKELLPLLRFLKEKEYYIELETNGTFSLLDETSSLLDQVNCSPKLSNSRVSYNLRIKLKALKNLASNDKVNFKFVVSQESDIMEILNLVNTYQMKKVILMPCGMTIDELQKTTAITKSLASYFKFIFSDRLHITLLGGGRRI